MTKWKVQITGIVAPEQEEETKEEKRQLHIFEYIDRGEARRILFADDVLILDFEPDGAGSVETVSLHFDWEEWKRKDLEWINSKGIGYGEDNEWKFAPWWLT